MKSSSPTGNTSSEGEGKGPTRHRKKKKKTRAKASAVEIRSRVNSLLALLVAGRTRAYIQQWVTDKTEWNVCSATVDVYLREATTKLHEVAEQLDLTEELAKTILRLEDLYQRAMSIQDYRVAHAIEKTKIALLGLSNK